MTALVIILVIALLIDGPPPGGGGHQPRPTKLPPAKIPFGGSAVRRP